MIVFSPTQPTCLSFAVISKTDLMEFRHYENGVYEFLFFKSSAQALDAWFVEIENFYRMPPDSHIPILVNTLFCNDQPLLYAFRRASEIIPKHPNRPKPMYYAYLGGLSASPMRKFLQEFIRRLNTGDKTLYLYGPNQFQTAIDWLLSWSNSKTE